MNRRNFLVSFILWMLSFIFGYKFGNMDIKNEDMNLEDKNISFSKKIELLGEKINQKAQQEDVNDRYINLRNYAENKIGDDWTPAINHAFSLYEELLDRTDKWVKLYVPAGEYIIRGTVNVPKYAVIEGDRKGLTQGIGTDTEEGGKRRNKITETVFKIIPNDINVTPFMLDDQSLLKGVAIIYPNQDPAVTSESNIIRYATTIQAKNGVGLENIRTWGAYNFFVGNGESITIKDIYGYTCGTAFYIKGSSDVCRIENVHLNPNVARPVEGFNNLSKSREESVAFFFEDCDGVHISNVHTWAYRTSLKVLGGSGRLQCNCTINNFFFDNTGLAFDIDSDSNWGIQINNGISVVGFSNDPDHAGFLRLNKTISKKFFTPVLINNVTIVQAEMFGLIPTYLVNFLFHYMFDVRMTNVAYDAFTTFISPHHSYVEGKVRSANTYMNLEKDYQLPNWINNFCMLEVRNDKGIPDYWEKDSGSRHLEVKRHITGFMELSTKDGMKGPYKGLRQRVILPANSEFRVTIKVRDFDVTSKIFVRAYKDGYKSPIEKTASFNASGYGQIIFTNVEARRIIDVIICPSLKTGGGVIVEKVQLVTDTRGYLV